METLLDRHLATFDTWLQAGFMSLTGSSLPHNYLTVFTLLDQLNLKQFDWHQVSVILRHQSLSYDLFAKLIILCEGTTPNIEFIQIVSKYFMDRDRAGSLWVDPRRYAGLAMDVLCILHDE